MTPPKAIGLYLLRWSNGTDDASPAAVGCNAAGEMWFAPVNWLTVPSYSWHLVKEATPLVFAEGRNRLEFADVKITPPESPAEPEPEVEPTVRAARINAATVILTKFGDVTYQRDVVEAARNYLKRELG